MSSYSIQKGQLLTALQKKHLERSEIILNQILTEKNKILKRFGKKFMVHCSPDLNPMNFSVWGYFQKKVCLKSHKNIPSLKKDLIKALKKFSIQMLHVTSNNMLRKLKAAVENKGYFS